MEKTREYSPLKKFHWRRKGVIYRAMSRAAVRKKRLFIKIGRFFEFRPFLDIMGGNDLRGEQLR